MFPQSLFSTNCNFKTFFGLPIFHNIWRLSRFQLLNYLLGMSLGALHLMPAVCLITLMHLSLRILKSEFGLCKDGIPLVADECVIQIKE